MKNLFDWMEEYGLGIDNIDTQHRQLFDIANRLWDELRPGDLEEVLMDIYRHTRQHFRDEEQFMKDMGYPELEGHRRQHDALLAQFNELSAKVVKDPAQLSALQTFLADWIADHTLNQDQRLHRFIEKSGAG
jgi:hemerythrin